ncbi:hypothetical protein F5B17DRAFT_445021 [Nemania serpens]|nr:hypothetical protein F5B17DRAFT_445021 [Nemania serpens]
MKRKNKEDHHQSRAKRQELTHQGLEVIELSDSDPHENDQSPAEELEPADSLSDDHGNRESDNEFGGRYANRHISEEDWKRQPLRDIQGGCLGDAMGLGKTIEVLCTFAMFAMIKANHAEVVSFWGGGVVGEGRRHLPREQAEGDRCPSQQTSPYPTECTCVRSGDPYEIARRMPSLPTICIIPPTAIRIWADEFSKALDKTHIIAKQLTLSIWHNDYVKGQQLYHGRDRVQSTAGAAVRRLSAEGDVQFLLLLVSRHSATKFYALYNGMSSRVLDEGGNSETVVMNLLGAAFVFFDEAHQYNGTLDNPTDPFRFLRSLRDTGLKEPVAFTISASIPLSGPIHLANIVEHALASRYLQGKEERIGGIDNARSLKAAQTDYQYLIDNLNRLTDEKTRKGIQARRENLDKLEKELVPCLLMARRETDTFRGVPIGDGGREIVVERINCPMLDGRARDAFRRMTAEVQSYVQRLLQEKRQEWKQDGQKGPEPTQQSVEAALFGSGADNNVAARMSQASQNTWMRLTRAGVYPFLAHLLATGMIQDGDLHHDAVKQLGVTACRAYFTAGWDEMVRVCEQSPLWPYCRELARQSPKFNQLCKFVDDMLSYRAQPRAANDPGPRDGTNIRHMIVLTQSPASAVITYMLLARAYRINVKVVLLSAATKKDASASDNGYGRNQIIDDLNSPCDANSPNTVIISTYRICGVALNLQRANYCIMMEPAGTTDAERQAAARVNRRGQEMRPVTVMLYDEHNFAESIRLSRRANHDEMLSWKEGGIPWDRFM